MKDQHPEVQINDPLNMEEFQEFAQRACKAYAHEWIDSHAAHEEDPLPPPLALEDAHASFEREPEPQDFFASAPILTSVKSEPEPQDGSAGAAEPSLAGVAVAAGPPQAEVAEPRDSSYAQQEEHCEAYVQWHQEAMNQRAVAEAELLHIVESIVQHIAVTDGDQELTVRRFGSKVVGTELMGSDMDVAVGSSKKKGQFDQVPRPLLPWQAWL